MTIEFPKNVRLANENDREKIIEFIKIGHAESAVFSLSEPKIEDFVDAAIYASHPIWIGIIDSPDKNKIAASLCVEYSQMWYTDEWHLNEKWNNVRKEYRKSNYANDLINFGKWLSEQSKRTLAMGIITNARVDAKVAMYRRKMPQVGAYFMYNAPKNFALEDVGGNDGR